MFCNPAFCYGHIQNKECISFITTGERKEKDTKTGVCDDCAKTWKFYCTGAEGVDCVKAPTNGEIHFRGYCLDCWIHHKKLCPCKDCFKKDLCYGTTLFDCVQYQQVLYTTPGKFHLLNLIV